MLRILLIHPRINSRSELAIKLREKGYDVIVASTKGAALYKASAFDIAIVDLNSNVRGVKFVKFLRNISPMAGIILLAEPGENIEDQQDGMLIGADACQIKPVDLDILFAYIPLLAHRIGLVA
jgi:DNA-binding response OmpR family regulator